MKKEGKVQERRGDTPHENASLSQQTRIVEMRPGIMGKGR